MAKQQGRALLIKIGDGADPEVFSTLCGLTTKSITHNNATIDVTTHDCTTPDGQLWQEVLTGTRSMSVSGNGLFEDSAAEEALRALAFGTGVTDTASAIANFQVIIPDFGTFQGGFHVDSLEFTGENESGVTYAVALSSSGAIAWTAD